MNKIPHHLGIILDGNRRWAQENKLPVFEGHIRGAKRTKEVIQWCKDRGVKVLTLFAFSTENWKRPKIEVAYLMKLLVSAFNKKNLKEVHNLGIRIKVIGQRDKLSRGLIKKIEEGTTVLNESPRSSKSAN